MRLADLAGRSNPPEYWEPTAALVHPHAKVGDEIYIIKGCSLPVVLRGKKEKKATEYGVVGSAWVDPLHPTARVSAYQDWSWGKTASKWGEMESKYAIAVPLLDLS